MYNSLCNPPLSPLELGSWSYTNKHGWNAQALASFRLESKSKNLQIKVISFVKCEIYLLVHKVRKKEIRFVKKIDWHVNWNLFLVWNSSFYLCTSMSTLCFERRNYLSKLVLIYLFLLLLLIFYFQELKKCNVVMWV